MKKAICALLCVLTLLAAFPAAARADSSYSTVSDKGVALEYPYPYVGTEKRAYVKAQSVDDYIYILPCPRYGCGYLGTLKHGTEVTILSEKDDCYFFSTADGREGWNNKKYFTILGRAGTIFFMDQATVDFPSGGSVKIPADFEAVSEGQYEDGAIVYYLFTHKESGKVLFLTEYRFADLDTTANKLVSEIYTSVLSGYAGECWSDILAEDGFHVEGKLSGDNDVNAATHCWVTDDTVCVLELDYEDWDLDGTWMADTIFESRCY